METALMNSEIIVKAFNQMGCDAISLGSKDFSAGLKNLKNLEKKSEFPFLSANITDELGINLFKPYMIVEKNGIRLGIIGLTSVFSNDEITVADPLPVLESLVGEVKAKSDFVVLLFHANETDVAAVRNSNLEIDLIIQSKSTRRSNDGGNYNIPVYTCGDKGKYIYRFDVNINGGGEIVDLSKFDSQRTSLERELRKKERKADTATIDNITPEDQKRFAEIKRLRTQMDQLNELKNSVKNSIGFEMIEMGKNITDEPEILLMVDEGKKHISNISSPPVIPYNQRSLKQN